MSRGFTNHIQCFSSRTDDYAFHIDQIQKLSTVDSSLFNSYLGAHSKSITGFNHFCYWLSEGLEIVVEAIGYVQIRGEKTEVTQQSSSIWRVVMWKMGTSCVAPDGIQRNVYKV